MVDSYKACLFDKKDGREATKAFIDKIKKAMEAKLTQC